MILYYLFYMLCKENNFIPKVKNFLDVSKIKMNKLHHTQKNYLHTFNSNYGNTYCLHVSPSATLTNLLFGRWWRGTARLRTSLPFLFITRSRTLPLSRIVTPLLTKQNHNTELEMAFQNKVDASHSYKSLVITKR